ncbi:YybH family protein [Dictyobacter aurantiacus]|uniref:DUF4440 domain-containing protein n=1 Tax=Dictyobacter aurantiacus TaxID=1936993 RepID=A0A401ZT72_9CHLR|nr:DUF4440 domain-containing protein [Dictyobacter aurantiacus]GCE10089.1 hypothetical protein KDAU_74180 [Dictyobacter aurantiacus]
MSNTTAAWDIMDRLAKVFSDAVKQRDVKALSKMHTRNARLLPPAEAIVCGQDAIRTYYQALVDNGVTGMQFTTLDAQFIGEHTIQNLSQIVVTIQLPDGQTQELQTKAVVLWQQEDDAYKIDIDIWNQF